MLKVLYLSMVLLLLCNNVAAQEFDDFITSESYYNAMKLKKAFQCKAAIKSFIKFEQNTNKDEERFCCLLRRAMAYNDIKKRDSVLICLNLAQDMLDKGLQIDSSLQLELTSRKATYLFSTKRYDESIETSKRNIKLKSRLFGPNSIELVNDLRSQGVCEMFKINYKKADSIFQIAKSIQDKHLEDNNVKKVTLLLALGKNERYQGLYQKSLEYANKAIQILDTNMDRIELLAEAYSIKSYAESKLGNPSLGIEDIKKTIDLYQSLEADTIVFKKKIITSYRTLANAYRKLHDFDKAIENIRYAIDYSKTEDKTITRSEIDAKLMLATILDKAYGESDEINEIHNSAIEWYRDTYGNNHHSLAHAIGNYSTYLAIHRHYEKAIKNAELAHQIYINNNKEFEMTGSFYIKDLLIFLYSKVGKFDIAEKICFEMHDFYVEKYGLESDKVVKSFSNISNLYQDQGKYKLAIEYGQKCLKKNEIRDTIGKYPEDCFDLNLEMGMLKGIAKSYGALYQKTKDENYLLDQIEVCEKAFHFINTRRKRNLMSESSYSLSSKYYFFYNYVIESNFLLFQLNGDQVYLDRIHSYFERSKVQSLLEHYKSEQVLEMVGVPKEIIEEKDNQMKLIRKFEEKVREAKAENKKDKLDLQKKMFDYQNEYEAIVRSINKKYPKYHNYLYQQDFLELSDCQEQLVEDDELLVSYYVSDSLVYSFFITKSLAEVKRIPFQKASKKEIVEYIDGLQKNNYDPKAALSIGKLLQLDDIKVKYPKVTKIKLVPDGILNFFPFETITQSNGHFLFEHYDISYAYSLTYVHGLERDKVSAKYNLLAFAPSYHDTSKMTVDTSEDKAIALLVREGMYHLPGAIKEVESISNLVKAKAYLSEHATEENFFKHAPDAKVLHFAMHSLVDNENPDNSRLLFFKDESTEEFNGNLTVGELCKMKLNAELAVLSACNTGIGLDQKGDGVYSLSKAFAFAGVNSTVMSLWRIPDEASSYIMYEFYKNLKNGDSKDLALSNAKRLYINDDAIPEANKTPYHWAGFIISGSLNPVSFNDQNTTILLGLLFLLMIVLLGAFAIRKTKTNN